MTVDENKPEQVLEVLKYITAHSSFRLIRLKDKLKVLKHVNANFIFNDKCVCEIQIRLGKPQVFYHGNHFLYEIQRM